MLLCYQDVSPGLPDSACKADCIGVHQHNAAMKQGTRGSKPRAIASAAVSDPQDTGYTACEPDRSYFHARRAPAKAHDAGSAALTELHISAPDLEHPRRTLAGLRVKHVNEKTALRAELEACFPRWYFQLRRAAPQPAVRLAPTPSCYMVGLL